MARRVGIRSGLLAVIAAMLVSSMWTPARAVDGGAGGKCTLGAQDQDCTGLNINICDQFNAICKNGFCACANATDGGAGNDAGTRGDGGTGGTGGTGGGMTGGNNGGSTPIMGGGMTFPAKSGCSFVP